MAEGSGVGFGELSGRGGTTSRRRRQPAGKEGSQEKVVDLSEGTLRSRMRLGEARRLGLHTMSSS